MGVRSGFVWGAYVTFAVLMLAEPLLARWRHRAARIAIAERMADEEAARSAASGARP